MKLLAKTTRYYLLIGIPIFLAAGLLFFFVMHYLLDNEATEQLYVEKQKVLSYLKSAREIPNVSFLVGDEIFIVPLTAHPAEQLKDTMIFTTTENENVPYRQLSFPVTFNNADYQITIRTTLYENDELLEVIMISMLVLLVLLFIMLFIMNRRLSKKLWQPFYETLGQLAGFKLSDAQSLMLIKTDVEEFRELNASLMQLTSKMQHDYFSLKEFTENASHELQTPLAVMKSKIELLMQSDGMEEAGMHQLQEVNESISRLSRLNQSLLLLSKIENRQFHETDSVLLNTVVEEKLLQWWEIILHRNIKVETSFDQKLYCRMDPALAETMIGNLLGNAIKHNEGGRIQISIRENSFTISNTGVQPSVMPSQFFERFKKESPASDSSGLGLAIVKEICNAYKFVIEYNYTDGWHRIQVTIG